MSKRKMFKNIPFEFETGSVLKSDDDKWIIEGYASTHNNIDRQDEIISKEALLKAEKDLLSNNTVFYEHKHDELPIGKVIDAKVDQTGLKIKVQISKTAGEIWQLIKEGVLHCFSIGGRVVKAVERYMKEQDKKVVEIQEIELLEVSLVGIPANPEARAIGWYISKALFGGAKEEMKEEKKIEPIEEKALTSSDVPGLPKEEPKVEEKKEEVKEEVLEKKEEPKVEEKKVEGAVKNNEEKCPTCGEILVDGKCPKCEIPPEKKDEDKPKEEKKLEEKEAKSTEGEIISKPEPEVVGDYVRIRQIDPEKFVQDSFRTIDISVDEGIKAVIGKLKTDPEGSTVVQTYLFDKEKWTVESAQKWVDEHKEEKTKEEGKKEDEYYYYYYEDYGKEKAKPKYYYYEYEKDGKKVRGSRPYYEKEEDKKDPCYEEYEKYPKKALKEMKAQIEEVKKEVADLKILIEKVASEFKPFIEAMGISEIKSSLLEVKELISKISEKKEEIPVVEKKEEVITPVVEKEIVPERKAIVVEPPYAKKIEEKSEAEKKAEKEQGWAKIIWKK